MSMSHALRISDIVARPHLKHFNSNHVHQIDHGGRGGYKSSKNSIKIALQMLKDPTCEVVVVRQDYSDHKDSTFAQLKWAFNKLGVPLEKGLNYPDGNDLWLKLPQGNYVHFKHMKEMDKLKGTLPRRAGNQIKIIWYFEVTNYKSSWYIDEANATFMRGDKDYVWALYEYNDPPKLSHWVYKWVEKMKKAKSAYVNKVNYNDAPTWQQKMFLGQILLDEIERLKEVDYEQFKSTYLALPANLTGSVYKKFDRSKHVGRVERNPLQYQKLTVGVDYGETDATVFTLFGLLRERKGARVLKRYWHKNGVSPEEKSILEYTDDFFDFMLEVYEEFGKVVKVYVDSASKTFWNHIRREKVRRGIANFIIETTRKEKRTRLGDNSIEERIAIVNIMFGADYLAIDESCEELIQALEECERDKNGDRRDDGTSDIDSLDSMEYSFLEDIESIYNAILRQKGYETSPLPTNNRIGVMT